MIFLKKLKDKFITFVNNLYSSIDKLTNKIFSKRSNLFDSEYVKIYHHKDFSYAFVDINKINLLSKQELESLLNYIINSVDTYLIQKDSVLINIITKVIFKDQLNIIYTHSLTYKQLFNLNDFHFWKSLLDKDIKELLNNYNDSQIVKIEFRFDYIAPSDLK